MMEVNLIWYRFEVTDAQILLFLLAAFGIVSALYLIAKGLISIWKALYSPYLGVWLGHNVNLRKLGGWAVVTGATDGIGKAYVEELARLGLNVVLISRTLEKLQDVAEAVASEFKVKTKVIPINFASGREIYDTIRTELEGLEVNVLVNNVGMSYTYPEYLHEIPNGDDGVHQLLSINCTAVTMMSRMILPQMMERKKGAIVNLSSGAGIIAVPLLSVYAASKSYVDMLSRCLQLEYSKFGITVQSVVPFYVTTKMSKIRQSSFFIPTPTEFVQYQLQTIGLEDRTYGYSTHKLQGYGAEFMNQHLPPFIYNWWYGNWMINLRKTYLEKKKFYAAKNGKSS